MTWTAWTRRRAVVVAVTLLAGAVTYAAPASQAAPAAPRTATRTVAASYARPGGVVLGGRPTITVAATDHPSRAPENQVRVRVTDDTGRPVALEVRWQPRGTTAVTSKVWCGQSPTLAIAVGSGVRVTVLAGTCPDGSVSPATSGSISIAFTRPLPPPVIAPGQRWAVVIGVQDYAGNTHSTYGGRGDVTAIRTALLRSGWRSDHILTLVDGQASAQAILDAMAWLAQRSGPSTFSLFHFSGHVCIASRGPCPSGHTFLWSYDNRFIPETSVGAVLGRVQGRAWLDFAGCESGAFDAGLSSAKRLVTASSQASETSYEQPDWRESVWSGLVWDRAFLHGDAGPQPGRATIGQMVAYGKAQAPRVTSRQPAGPQHPYVAGGDPTQTLYAPHP